MKDLVRYTSIGRPLDIQYATNKAILCILAVSLIVSLFYFRLQNLPIIQGIISSFLFTAGVFFCWAIGREIDPEHDISAFVGLIFLLPLYLWIDQVNLFVLFWLLISFRIINRSTGYPVGIIDLMIYLIIIIVLVLTFHQIIALLSAMIFFIEAVASKRRIPLFLLSMVCLLFFITSFIFGDSIQILSFSLPAQSIFMVIIGTVLMIGLIIDSKNSTCLSDNRETEISSRRIQLTQTSALIIALVFIGTKGNAGLYELYILWSIFFGISTYRIIERLVRKYY